MDAGHRRTYSGSEGRYQRVEASRSASTRFVEGCPFGGCANRVTICTGDKTRPGPYRWKLDNNPVKLAYGGFAAIS